MQATGNKPRTRPKKAEKLKPNDPEQSRRFLEKAREIGADDERSAADELLGQLHKKPPAPRVKLPKNK